MARYFSFRKFTDSENMARNQWIGYRSRRVFSSGAILLVLCPIQPLETGSRCNALTVLS
jgi:hypothetical protein